MDEIPDVQRSVEPGFGTAQKDGLHPKGHTGSAKSCPNSSKMLSVLYFFNNNL
jgi:hypothetical protein